MLLPLLGLVFGIVVSVILGTAVFTISPKWKLTILNITLFMVGSFVAAIGSSSLYTVLFADENRQLQSSQAVLGYFITLLVATLLGGISATYIGRHLLKKFGWMPADVGS